MTPEEFKKAHFSLTLKQREVLEKFWDGKTDKAIAREMSCSDGNVRTHIEKICDKFDLKKEGEPKGSKHRHELKEIYAKHQQDLFDDEFFQEYDLKNGNFNLAVLGKYNIENRKFNGEFKLESTEGTVPLKSPFYVERSSIESFCYQTIIEPGALIPIKAPREMGKSSLLDRILDRGRQEGYQTVRLNLCQIPPKKCADINTFMRCFCFLIRKELPDNLPQVDELWDDEIGGASATGYLQAVLEGLEIPLILGLDEVDNVFDYEDVYQYFLPLLRAWHEEANSLEIWENLRLVVVHSTEDYGRLDLNKSPFNVRSAVELRDFSPEEIADLAGRHRLNLTSRQLEDLRALIGGHPYLVRLAFDRLARGDTSLEMLLENAATDAGIYQGHLLRHLEILNENFALKASFKEVIFCGEAVQIDGLKSRKLYSMGLIVKQGNLVMPRCPLYRQYFRERL